MPQRCHFKAVGLIWLFYSDGTNLCFRTSSDGITWSGKTTVRACTLGDYFSVRHAEYLGVNYVYYAFSEGVRLYPLIFRRGVLNADGTITNVLYGNLWDGAAWVGEETIDPAGTLSRYFGLASLGDTVIVAFEETALGDENIYSRRRNGVWSARELVSSTAPNPNTLSVDPVTGETFCFWVERHGYGVNIYNCKRNTVWGATEVLASGEVYPKILTCSAWREMLNNQIGVAWVSQETAPHYLRYHIYTPVVIVRVSWGDGLVWVEESAN